MINGADVMGMTVVGYDVDGAALMKRAAHPAQARQLLGLHQPHWRGMPGGAPGLNLPTENRKFLPLEPDTQGGIFTAVTDRIRFRARPQLAFLGERLFIDPVKIGTAALATRVRASTFAVGTTSQLVELGNIGLDKFNSQALDVNMKMDRVEPGGLIILDIFLVGPAFTPGTDSINLSGGVEILGRSIG